MYQIIVFESATVTGNSFVSTKFQSCRLTWNVRQHQLGQNADIQYFIFNIILAGSFKFLPETISIDSQLMLIRNNIKDEKTFKEITAGVWTMLEKDIEPGQITQLQKLQTSLNQQDKLTGMLIAISKR